MECLHTNQDTGLEEGEEEDGEGGNPFRDAAYTILNSLDLNLTLTAAEGRMGRNRHGGGGEATGGSRRRRRILFRSLICTARGLGLPPTTKDNTAPCRGYILSARVPYAARAEAVLGTSSAKTMSAGGGRGRGCPRIRAIPPIHLRVQAVPSPASHRI